MTKDRTYLAIDLKSFYASVECRENGFDPLTTHLVVADQSRTAKTICLAVSPSLKAYGISGRARLFEVIRSVEQINRERMGRAPGHRFSGASRDAEELKDPSLKLDFHVIPPHMAKYMEYSTRIYGIYLKYIAPEDIHVYSIDEVFIDATAYLGTYGLTPKELTKKLIREVLTETGITATAGIGTNLYLAKVAMDIMAKHVEADADGVRIAELTERSYRETLWSHTPLTDFWRVGRGYARKLEENGLFTMGDIARCSERGGRQGEELLYKLFGVNAELLIDHAWGWEPCTIAEIKAYQPESSSLGSGQVLHCPYESGKGKLIVREMADLLALSLVEKGLVCDSIVLTVGYDIENLTDPARRSRYHGKITTDFYGRQVPKHAHGTIRLGKHTSSARKIVDASMELYDRIINTELLIRRVNIVANNVVKESELPPEEPQYEQLELFTDYAAIERARQEEQQALEREKRMQKAEIEIKKRFGKNAILKGMNLEEGATTIDRNNQIGGHRRA